MASNIIPIPGMGSNDNNDPTPPQPGLRSFIVYDELPEGCIALEVADDSQSPHLNQGEFAVVDTNDREPMHGEMFAIRWSGEKIGLIEARLRLGRYGTGPNGEMQDDCLWWGTWRAAIMSLAGAPNVPCPWGDGPYREHHFREKLIGRVVGIYQPDFRLQLREAA